MPIDNMRHLSGPSLFCLLISFGKEMQASSSQDHL